VLEEVGVHRGVDQVVDRDHLDIGRSLDQCLERLATDAAEAVDANADCHRSCSFMSAASPTEGRRDWVSGWGAAATRIAGAASVRMVAS
jgi:hypothetical protein